LTTVTVTIDEIKNYVPPAPPTFGAQLGRTLRSSLNMMMEAGKGIVIFIVGVLPWLIVLALIAVPVLMIKRRYRK
jgi:hypothetical protein